MPSPGLKLPPLNQILDYHPPSLKNLFQIDSISKSSSLALSRPDSVLRTHFDYIVENIGGG